MSVEDINRFTKDDVVCALETVSYTHLDVYKRQWQTFMDGLNGFTSDIFEGGRDQGVQEERESL